MKRIMIIPAITLFALMIFSCQRSWGTQAPAAAAPGETGEAAAALSAQNHAYILRVNAAFYTLENDTSSEADRTRWTAAMSLGERVTLGDPRRATFSGDGRVYDFVEVRRDNGSQGLAWAAHVAPAGSLAVVVDERANLFRTPRAIDVTGIILSRKTVVVTYPETENDGYVEIRAYDPEAQANRNNFIRLNSISERNSDIQSSILMQTAQPLGNEGAEKIRKDALLETALLDYPDSAFSADIQALVNPNVSFAIATEWASRSFMYVTHDNVNVRELPDQVIGTVIGRLDADTEVTVSEQTVSESTIGGQSARWYRITEPLEGWVFGAYLE